MSRADNWRTLLADFIEARRERAFEWGSHDCCLFAADWVALVTGKDPAQAFRHSYSSAMGAHDIYTQFGGVPALVRHCLRDAGFVRVSQEQASAGDLIVRESGQGKCVGIVLGLNSAFVGEDGLRFARTDEDPEATFWKF